MISHESENDTDSDAIIETFFNSKGTIRLNQSRLIKKSAAVSKPEEEIIPRHLVPSSSKSKGSGLDELDDLNLKEKIRGFKRASKSNLIFLFFNINSMNLTVIFDTILNPTTYNPETSLGPKRNPRSYLSGLI
jgi:hypothetical protein